MAMMGTTRATRNFFSFLLQKYNIVDSSHPYMVHSSICGALWFAGDLMAQKIESNPKKINLDVNRLAVMTLYGSMFQGPLNRIWYSQLAKRVQYPSNERRKEIMVKMFYDSFLFAPFSTFLFYACTTPLEKRCFQEVKTQLKENYVPTLMLDVVIWAPVQTINFACVKPQHNAMVVNCITLFYNTLLSYIAHNNPFSSK
jgi:protein Mpv17